jgi:hypothetical protein
MSADFTAAGPQVRKPMTISYTIVCDASTREFIDLIRA